MQGDSEQQSARELRLSRNTARRHLELPEPDRRERWPRRWLVFDSVQPRLEDLLGDWSE